MNEQEVRLECLKLVLEYRLKESQMNILQVAEVLTNYVLNGIKEAEVE